MRTSDTNFENFSCINKDFKAKLIINLESGRNDIYLDAAILSYYMGTIFIVIDSTNRVALSKNNTINSKRDYVKIPEFCKDAVNIINFDCKYKMEITVTGDVVVIEDRVLEESINILITDKMDAQLVALKGFLQFLRKRRERL